MHSKPLIPVNPFSSRYTRPGALPYQYAEREEVSISFDDRRELSVTELLQKLRRYRCGCIVGPHGTGKSTLLHDMAPDLKTAMPGGRWVGLVRDGSGLGSVGKGVLCPLQNDVAVRTEQLKVREGGVLIIDGAEQMTPWGRWRVRFEAWRRNHYCLVTSHRTLSGYACMYETAISPPILEDLVNLIAKQTECGDVAQKAFGVWTRERDLSSVVNTRDLWSELYDEVSYQQQESDPPWPSV